MDIQKAYLVALAAAPGIGPKKTEVLLKFFKQPEEVWKADDRDLRRILVEKDFTQFLDYKKKIDVESNFESLSNQGIKVITILEDTYPSLLGQISSPPPVLYYRGDFLATVSRPTIAVVGTRLISLYGREVTERLVESLVASGLTIVSGLAKGVDSCAHRTTLDNNGLTIAVLGSGLNNIFPSENNKLALDIIKNGGAVVSEYPPQMESLPGNFPARNRIISGLSIGVLVTEAAEDSGSLITADFASEQGRDVFAVPGPITSKLSAGPSKLLKVGAKLVTGVEDILEELKLGIGGTEKSPTTFMPGNLQEEKVWQCLVEGAKSIDQIVRETGLSPAVVSSTVTLMEINGFLRNLGTGVYAQR